MHTLFPILCCFIIYIQCGYNLLKISLTLCMMKNINRYDRYITYIIIRCLSSSLVPNFYISLGTLHYGALIIVYFDVHYMFTQYLNILIVQVIPEMGPSPLLLRDYRFEELSDFPLLLLFLLNWIITRFVVIIPTLGIQHQFHICGRE